jgi:hypothetical protein
MTEKKSDSSLPSSSRRERQRAAYTQGQEGAVHMGFGVELPKIRVADRSKWSSMPCLRASSAWSAKMPSGGELL